VVVAIGSRSLAVACRAVVFGATTVRHPPEEGGSLCTVCQAVYICVPGVAVGLENSRLVLRNPAAAALNGRAVAVRGRCAELLAVEAEGEALPGRVPRAAAAVTLVRARPFEADVGAGNEVALRHGLYLPLKEALTRRIGVLQ
jgi:hypothetical protein